MNVKKTVKKMSAILAGATMLGATVFGAMAYTLSDYPSPFVQNGVFNGKIVVGAQAQAQDIIGASDIAASIQAASKTPATAGGTAVGYEGAEQIDTFALNAYVNGKGPFGESDLAGFQDKTVRWDKKDIDVIDQISIADNTLRVATFNGNTSASDEDFGSNPYMVVDAVGNIKYTYAIDDADFNYLAVSDDKPLRIRFLGKDLKITAMTSTSMTVESSEEVFLTEGSQTTVEGHTVVLLGVAESSVRVSVDGQVKIISSGDTATFNNADDFEVEVDSIFFVRDGTNNGANLRLGNEVTQTVSNGKSMELFGESSTVSKAEWLWEISTSAVTNYNISAKQNMLRKQMDVDEYNRAPLAVGEALEFPNGHASIEFSGFDDARQTTYSDVSFRAATVTISGSSKKVVEVSTTKAGKLFTIGGNKAEKVLLGNTSYWYYDGDEYSAETNYTGFNITHATNTYNFTLKLDKEDANIIVNWVNATPNVRKVELALGTDSYLSMNWTATSGDWQLGTTQKDADAGDIMYGGVQLYNVEEGIRTTYGATLNDPESMAGRDNVVISVPHEAQQPVITIKSKGSTMVAGGSDTGAYIVNPLPVGSTVLDTDAEQLIGSTPLIVVGGPFVNTVAAELMGNPTTEEINALFSPGLAKIKLYADKNALLVAGYNAQDTLGAAYVLADYADYALTGSEVEVVVPSLSSLSVRAPTLP